MRVLGLLLHTSVINFIALRTNGATTTEFQGLRRGRSLKFQHQASTHSGAGEKVTHNLKFVGNIEKYTNNQNTWHAPVWLVSVSYQAEMFLKLLFVVSVVIQVQHTVHLL